MNWTGDKHNVVPNSGKVQTHPVVSACVVDCLRAMPCALVCVFVCVIPPDVTDLRRIYFRDLQLVCGENTDGGEVTSLSFLLRRDFTHPDLRLKFEGYIIIIIIITIVV